MAALTPGRRLPLEPMHELGQYVCANIMLPYHMMKLQARKFVFQLAHFLYISVHHLLVAVPLFVDLLND
jgi:hypothetical protein